MPKSSMQTQRALIFLQDGFARWKWNVGERLPSARALAAKAGVSYFPMWKALKELERQKMVSIRKNKGVYVEHPGMQQSYIGQLAVETQLPESLIWRFICILFERGMIEQTDLVRLVKNAASGISFDEEEQLMNGISQKQHTLLLESLATKGALLPGAVRKFVEECRKAGYENPVKLHPAVSDTEVMNEPSYRWEQVGRAIEKDIVGGRFIQGALLPTASELKYRYGVCFVTLKKALKSVEKRGYISPFKKTFRVNTLNRISVRSRITLLLYSPEPGKFLMTPRVVEVLRTLEKECPLRNISFDLSGYMVKNKSLVFVDREGRFSDMPPVGSGNMLGYIFIENAGFGKSFGATFGAQMHRTIPVAIIDETASMGSYVREGSNFKVFETATDSNPGLEVGQLLLSLGHREVAFVSPYHIHAWSVNRFRGLYDSFAAAGFARGVHSHVKYLESRWHFESAVQMEWINSIENSLREMLKKYEKMSPLITSFLGGRFIPYVSQEGANIREYMGVRPLIDSALTKGNPTALLCVNDHVGMAALDYLREKRVKVPREISVIGFDDSPESFVAGMSTYNFNFSDIVMQALNYVLNPRDRNFMHRNTIVCKGFVVERETTGKVPKKK